MEVLEIIRIIFAAAFMFAGLFILSIATLGLFRLKNALNRLHAAAKCDSLGALFILASLAITGGFNFMAVKLFILLVFIWITNPISTYMIGRAEILTNPEIEEECDVIDL